MAQRRPFHAKSGKFKLQNARDLMPAQLSICGLPDPLFAPAENEVTCKHCIRRLLEGSY